MLKNLRLIKHLDPDPTALMKEKIQTAEELFENWKDYFYRDDKFLDYLKRYEKAVNLSNQTMLNLETFNECYVCSVIDKKGCCKAGIEAEVTINILLLNLFLEKPIPKDREIPLKCFFVGPTGCKIFARPFICRDYFCRRLLNKLSHADYTLITQILNDELTLLYEITRYIRKQLEFLLGDFLLELDIVGYCWE
ncbi:hypothetical protein F1847_08635 [Thermodesulfobacterium sp. TA1]|uniref:hypothetical protein n=1 Tax=Thermodesulfobacterium sp. TA1 TaxID=2234087 RepID=UPI001231F9DA|nr:hypothetical protein [Thermodesulfobacterium sp. TA1]QER42808.1 hypothetical protein F1847_08635 [Thermodesulfobacterium sp. TA1]